MRIGLIGAMDVEIKALMHKISFMESLSLGNRVFYVGKYFDTEVVLVKSGIGKVNASITTTLLIEHFHVEQIINIGVAGGVKANPFDICLLDKIAYHDIDTKDPNSELGQVQGYPLYYCSNEALLEKAKKVGQKVLVGTGITGDIFVNSKAEVPFLAKHSDVLTVDCESAAIAHVAYDFNVPVLIIRGVSDKLDSTDQMGEYFAQIDSSANKVIDYVLKIIS